ncbi:NrfD/PsrC family molybdoenzyme membrane anchor subunit [Kineosporia sp. A_224]|uniref:NrfD/PsrC family molybdoenzyme membrane anchor subunit n=1 Tax=Kineosporia sp. A_224 TaxID=1962180 RepID=UPI00117B7BB9|nr:NrfD/PsrC family molybdoenzyme membrane anchor subunit [Kineosporia sp. A_224]
MSAVTNAAVTNAAATNPAAATETVRATCLRALRRPGTGWWTVVLVLSAVVALGVYAWTVQLRQGMGAAGFNDQAFWAADIADVIALIGVSYGGAVVSAVLRLTGATWRAPLTRIAEGAAVCTVLVGMALIVPHIGNPVRLYELVTHPNTSAPVFWDFIAVSTYGFASVAFFAMPLVPDSAALLAADDGRLGRFRTALYRRIARGWTGAPRQHHVLAKALTLVSVMIIPLAVSVHSVLAWAFATTSRPWWHESIWAPQFVVAALYSGVALVILVVAGFRSGYGLQQWITPRHFVRLGFLMAALGAGYVYFTFADILPGAYVGENAVGTVLADLLVGRMAGWFWLFVVGGAVIPLLLVAIPATRTTAGMVVAASFVVPMLWLKRYLMVVTPANYDVVTGGHGAYHLTWVRACITLAAVAAVPLLLMLMFRVVPILSVDEIEEVELEERRTLTQALAALRAAGDGRATAPAARTVGAGLAVLVLAGAFGVLGVGRAAPAQAAQAPKGPRIELAGTQTDGLVHLTVSVKDAKGAPAAGGTVTFSVMTTVFGPRAVPLGSVPVTKGVAEMVLDGAHSGGYRPTQAGPTEFTASYAAQVGDTPLERSVDVDVTAAVSAYTPAAPKPLEGVGAVTPTVLFAVVGAVWVTLLTTVARVLLVSRRRVVRRVPATEPATAGRPTTQSA